MIILMSITHDSMWGFTRSTNFKDISRMDHVTGSMVSSANKDTPTPAP